MSALGNWIRATSTTTGTGNLTLSSVSGYVAPSTAFATGERFRYVLLADSDGKPIEAGIGYLSSGALVREFVDLTYSSGTYTESTSTAGLSAVSLSVTVRVICAPIHADIANMSIAGITTGTQANDTFAPFNFELPTTGSLSLSSNSRSYYIPAYLGWTHAVDAISFRTGSTVGNTDVGLYSTLPNGMPGDLLIGWANQTVSGSALNSYTFSSRTDGRWAAATRIIPPGWYWFYLNSAASMSFARLFSLYHQSMIPSGGFDTGARQTCLIINRTQGTFAQPAPTGGLSLATINGSTDVVLVPALGFRRAA